VNTTPLRSLRARLVVLVLLAVIPSLALILYSARAQRVAALETAHENVSRIARLCAADGSRLIEGAQQLLGALSQFQEIRSGDPAGCGGVMARLLKIYPVYSTLGVASVDGNVICSAVSLTAPVTVADQSWFQEVRRSQDFVVGECQVDQQTHRPSITLGCPIDGDGQVRSIVFAILDPRYFNRLADLVQLPEGASLVIADRKGAILADLSGSDLEGHPSLESSLIKSAGAYRGRVMTEVSGSDGVRRICGVYPITVGKRGAADAYVSVSIPVHIALAEANEQLMHNLLGLAVVSLLALAAAWFGGHTFVLGKANDELELRVQERTQALTHEQLLLRMLMDNMPDTIYFKDAQSRFTRVNRAQAEVLGLKSPAEAIGKNDFDFFTSEHAQAASADERKILESGQGMIGKTERIRRADGRSRWVTATKVPLRDDNGKVVGLVGVSRDVTEHVMAEHLLQVLVDSLPDLVYVKDTHGHYVVDNAAHRKFIGLQNSEQLVGKTAFDFYPRELAEKIQADDRAVLDSKFPLLNREEHFVNLRGEKTLVSTSKIPYRDEEGVIVGLVCTSRIIGERK
jgi:PAS domain S-box-containing protein